MSEEETEIEIDAEDFEDEEFDPDDQPLICPKCGKEYKSQYHYDRHVKSCEGPEEEEAEESEEEEVEPLTEEEEAEQRREYVREWSKAFANTTLRLKEHSDEHLWLEKRAEELEKDYTQVGRATVIKLLLYEAMDTWPEPDEKIGELAIKYIGEPGPEEPEEIEESEEEEESLTEEE